jgi:type I restriction enzyme S subunit
MARKMKDSGIEWIGEIPEGWEIVPVRSCFDEVRTKNTDGQEQNALQFKSGNIISKTNFNASMDDYVADTITNYTVVLPDTVMINGLNLNYDFKSLRVALVKEKGVITSAYLAIFPDRKKIFPQYATYLFKGYESKMAFHNMGAGIRKTLGYKEFKNQPLLLPSKEEQNKISAYLDSKCSHIDIMLSKIRSSIEEYKKLKQTVITQAVTKGVRGEREMKDSGVAWIGTYPSNWKIIKIKWLLHERKDRSITGLEEPLSMSQKKGLIPTKDMDSIPNMASSFIGAKLVYKGDLVFNKLKAHLGVFSVSKYNGLVSPDYAVYHSTGPANLNFLELLFKTPQYINEFKKKSSGVGAGLTRLYTGDLYSIYCALPPLVEQEEIADYLDAKCAEIDKLIAKKEQLVKEMESYKKSLIYEVVTGKREV